MIALLSVSAHPVLCGMLTFAAGYLIGGASASALLAWIDRPGRSAEIFASEENPFC